MNGIQKTIKVIAICLAITIIVSIFSGVFYILSMLLDINVNLDRDIKTKNYSRTFNNVSSIEIDVTASSIEIKEGTEFKIDAKEVSTNFSAKLEDNTLEIEEDKLPFSKKNNGQITIYIPQNSVLNELSINSGAAKIEISNVNSNEFDIDNGAGLLTINNSMFNSTEIDGGAGKIEINNSTLNNLDLDTGVGEVTINSKITGISKIDCGVGNINIKLIGNKEDYKIKTSKGIGTIKINNEIQTSDNIYGKGNNIIDLDGGVGSINVNFQE